jgi:hypothetical protein
VRLVRAARVISQEFASVCYSATGFSLSYNLLLSAAMTTTFIADSFSISIISAAAYSSTWTAGSSSSFAIPYTSMYGAKFPQPPGVTLSVDLYDNGDGSGAGYRAWGSLGGDSGLTSLAANVGDASVGLRLLLYAATGSSISHTINYTASTDSISWYIGNQAVLSSVPALGNMPSSFYLVFTVSTGGSSVTAEVSGPLTLVCGAGSSVQPRSPPTPPPSPSPPNPPLAPPLCAGMTAEECIASLSFWH